MKQFKIYIGHNNTNSEQIDLNILESLIRSKYKEIIGYTIYKVDGFFNGEFQTYKEKTIILEIVTDNLNNIYIEELCLTLKALFEQECILYTEHAIKAKLI